MPGKTKEGFALVVIFELGIKNSFSGYLWSTYYVLGIMLDIGDTEVYKTDKNSLPHAAYP
jgi:hypothetical protein